MGRERSDSYLRELQAKRDWLVFLFLAIVLALLLLLSGCAGNYLIRTDGSIATDKDGNPLRVSDYTVQVQAERSAKTANLNSCTTALATQGLTAVQVLAIHNACERGTAVTISRHRSWDDRLTQNGLPWLRFLWGTGWFSNNGDSNSSGSPTYVVNGNNNSLAGIGNSNSARRDGSMSFVSTPTVSSRQQQGINGGATGDTSSQETPLIYPE